MDVSSEPLAVGAFDPRYHIHDADVRRDLVPPGGFIQSFCEFYSRQTDAPMIYALASSYAVLSAAVSTSLHSWGFGGNKDFMNLYILLLGPQGMSRKTAAMKAAVRVLRESVPSRVGLDSGSYEGLLINLDKDNHFLNVAYDWSRFLHQSRGNGHLHALKEGLKDMYDCEGGRQTTARGVRGAEDPRLSLLIGINLPDLIQYMEPGDLSGGLWSRFLVFDGVRERFMTRRDIIPDTEGQLALIGKLKSWARRCPGGRLVYTKKCQDIMDKWERELEAQAQAAAAKRDDTYAALLTRTSATTTRLAGLIAVDMLLGANPTRRYNKKYVLKVSARAYRYAMALTRFHLRGAKRVIDSYYPNRDMQDRQAVLEALSDGQYHTYGQLVPAVKFTGRRLEETLKSLMREELVCEQEYGPTNSRVRYARTDVPGGIAEKAQKAEGEVVETEDDAEMCVEDSGTGWKRGRQHADDLDDGEPIDDLDVVLV